MKKILLVTVILGAFTLASCKKERTCTCTVSSTDVGTSYAAGVGSGYNNVSKPTKTVTVYDKISKKKAKWAGEYCVSKTVTVNYDNSSGTGVLQSGSVGAKTSTTECELTK